MKLKEETGLASCYITCANKTDRQGEKVEKIKHRWNNRILDIKKRERNRKKKLKLPFRSICPSPFKSAVLMISLTSSSVNWLWRFIIVHLNSSALINPLPSMSNTLNISRISASVSVSFIRVSIGGEILKSQWCHCLEKKCKSSSV